jgi:hypothetical protein
MNRTDCSYSISAIMRGAVLHKLGLDMVKDRFVRRSYGVTYNAEFRKGQHPSSRKIVCIDGVTRCENVMDWYAKKVNNFDHFQTNLIYRVTNLQIMFPKNILSSGISQLLNIRKKDLSCIEQNYTAARDPFLLNTSKAIMVIILLVSSDNPVTPLADLCVDLRKLPPDAITERNGPKGTYYRVDYDLGVKFGAAGIEFTFLYQGKVMGYVDANYY